ncbi:hypothetical protein Taro_008026 [Colocasia esculenta]|uniref:Uncharacterized protein n=1 Tax=Colocasia esculenta TaxID=4460 RepID=A0A843TX60_COLES|nr:hypothetical protein [Colocasia esculenta]
MIHDALDSVPFGHVQWTPYVGEDDAAQPWVEWGHPYFGRDICLHSFNTVEPLHHRLVARTLGLHQSVYEQLTDWEQRGREVVSEATSDEDYFRAYARRYGAEVYKGSRRPFDPEGRIASLEGILHSTIQQRDDLQAVVDQSGPADGGRGLFLPRGPRPLGIGGPVSGSSGPSRGCSAQVREREAELRDSLARTTALEGEMAKLRLHPEAAEVTRWRQEAEEATRLRTKAGDLRTQLGEERHCCELLRSEMKGLERALALVKHSRSSVSRSGIPSGSAGHYLIGSSGRRRNEEEA